MTPREMKAEVALFWRLSRSLAALRVAAPAFGAGKPGPILGPKIAETLDDLCVISMHSEWPALRTRALAALADDAARRARA